MAKFTMGETVSIKGALRLISSVMFGRYKQITRQIAPASEEMCSEYLVIFW
jgi:hypothetical protein